MPSKRPEATPQRSRLFFLDRPFCMVKAPSSNCSRQGNSRPTVVVIGSFDLSRLGLSSCKPTTTWSGVDFSAEKKPKAIVRQKSQKTTDFRPVCDRHETDVKRHDSIGRTGIWVDSSSKCPHNDRKRRRNDLVCSFQIGRFAW
jgi:hypothetical protein